MLALYPSGGLAASWWRWPVGAVVAGLVVITVVASLKLSAYDDIAAGPAPITIPDGWWDPVVAVGAFALILGGTLTIWVGTGRRLVGARSPERQQLAWLVASVAALYVSVFLAGGSLLWVTSFLLPIAVGVGILRYGMLGVVLSRGLTYGLLTALVLGVFVGVTALTRAVLEQRSDVGVAAAALAAVGLAPARERVQRGVDRFVWGERRDPIRAVEGLGVQVADADQGDLLDACSPGDRYSAEDLRVLAALAPQVAVVVHALDLAGALEEQRDTVVAATAGERERLRRELHDGLGPSLSGVALGLQATADALAGGRPGDAEQLVARIRAEVDLSVLEVRHILDGLRPVALDVDGLHAALSRRAAALGPALDVDVTIDDLPLLTPEVETAAYRIADDGTGIAPGA